MIEPASPQAEPRDAGVDREGGWKVGVATGGRRDGGEGDARHHAAGIAAHDDRNGRPVARGCGRIERMPYEAQKDILNLQPVDPDIGQRVREFEFKAEPRLSSACASSNPRISATSSGICDRPVRGRRKCVQRADAPHVGAGVERDAADLVEYLRRPDRSTPETIGPACGSRPARRRRSRRAVDSSNARSRSRVPPVRPNAPSPRRVRRYFPGQVRGLATVP